MNTIIQSTITMNWKFLEDNLKKYKGFDENNFFYYLKESEFTFLILYSFNQQKDIIINFLNTVILENNVS